MKSSEYWQQRFTLLEEARNQNNINYLKILKEQYDKSLLQIEKDISNWYTRIAVNNQVSYADVKRMLDKKELKEFKWTVEEYIEKGKQNAINQEWIKELENASARVHIDRLEAMKIQIQSELELLCNKQDEEMKQLMKQQYENTYYKSAYEIQKGLEQYWNIQPLDTNKIDKIISKPWTTDNKTFSDRIWNNKKELTKTLQVELTQATIRGDNLDNIIKSISKQFNVSKGKAGRLVMTESAFFSSAGQKECFNNLNVKKYENVATLDKNTSEICQEIDGTVFAMKDYEVGVTAPPFHPNCRTCTAPHFDDEFAEGEKRAYRDENGKIGYVDSKMKYKEWYEKYVSQDEDIMDSIFNKNNNQNLKDITHQKKQIIKNSFKNENMKNIALNTNVQSIKTGGNKSYHKNGNIVLKDNYNSHTIRHEIGHAIDYNNDWISANKNFIKAIQIDKENILNNIDMYKKLIKNNSNYIELSDIMSGITSNKIKGRYRHSNEYWKKENKLQREIFAQMFATAGNDDFKQLEIFQEYLPNIFKEFDNLIRRLL